MSPEDDCEEIFEIDCKIMYPRKWYVQNFSHSTCINMHLQRGDRDCIKPVYRG